MAAATEKPRVHEPARILASLGGAWFIVVTAHSMDSLVVSVRFAAIALGLSLVCQAPARAEEAKPAPCNQDAMIVFDASGSMSGVVGAGVATTISRIDEVRSALATVLPSATRFRRVGLITYGPGPYNQCNVHLDLRPTANAAEAIMGESIQPVHG